MTTLESKIDSGIFLTDGGLETDLIFNKGIDLPHFASFPLLEQQDGREILRNYYLEYMNLAFAQGAGFILESPTWRANTDWGFKLGYDSSELIRINRKSIEFLKDLAGDYLKEIDPILISGQLGPRGDGYQVENSMSKEESEEYHKLQIDAFAQAGADMISAITMTYSDEALGIVLRAQEVKIPVVISFTVETNGHLPSGESLEHAIRKVDELTNYYPLYYMINCAHPSHFIDQFAENTAWQDRIKGVRANASCKSHAELDESTSIDKGDLAELGSWHVKLKKALPELRIYGGCCGTDVSHIESICQHVFNSSGEIQKAS